MARKEIIASDLSGKEGAETVTFAVNGQGYEIDLTSEEAETLYNTFAKWVDVSRPINIPVRSKTPSRAKTIRAWAKSQGIEVNERGRVNPEVVAKYDEAH